METHENFEENLQYIINACREGKLLPLVIIGVTPDGYGQTIATCDAEEELSHLKDALQQAELEYKQNKN